MKDKLITRINQFGSFKEEECNAFSEILREIEFPKKSIVIQPERIASQIYFIVKGGFRSYFIKNGEDVTDYFFFEDSFATDYASLYSGKPSKFYLEAIEYTYAVAYSRNDFLRLSKQYPVFNIFSRIHAERAFVEIEERMKILHHEPLNVKYDYTIDKFPELFQRVPQHQIASYLGVKPESLSRVKKQKYLRKMKS